MHQCLNGLAPSFLPGDWISSVPGRRQLRSAASGQLYIPRTKTTTFGPRSFKVSGPTIWNDLPARLKDSSLIKNSFRKLLKTFLDDRYFCEFAVYINLRGEMFVMNICLITCWNSLEPLGIRDESSNKKNKLNIISSRLRVGGYFENVTKRDGGGWVELNLTSR